MKRQLSKMAVALGILVMMPPAIIADGQPAALRHFQRRIEAYMKLHDKAASGSAAQKSSSSPEAVVAAQQELARKIREQRAGASAGTIFASPVSTYIRHQIKIALKSPEGSAIRETLRSAEPVKDIHVEVNGSWPETVPLQSMPAGILDRLPKLPKELEYRLVGSTLVLRDEPANLIVDYLPKAVELP